MQKNASPSANRFLPIDLPDFDSTYVDKKTIEAHIRRAQAISEHISQFSSFISELFTGLTTWYTKKKERQFLRDELNSFSDYELSDIGISRCDIEDIVAGTFVGRRSDFDTTNVKVLKQPKAVDDLTQQDDASIAA